MYICMYDLYENRETIARSYLENHCEGYSRKHGNQKGI